MTCGCFNFIQFRDVVADWYYRGSSEEGRFSLLGVVNSGVFAVTEIRNHLQLIFPALVFYSLDAGFLGEMSLTNE